MAVAVLLAGSGSSVLLLTVAVLSKRPGREAVGHRDDDLDGALFTRGNGACGAADLGVDGARHPGVGGGR